MIKKSYTKKPSGYREEKRVDLHEKKIYQALNLSAVLTLLLFGVVPIAKTMKASVVMDNDAALPLLLRLIVSVAVMIACTILHELIHKWVMQYYGAEAHIHWFSKKLTPNCYSESYFERNAFVNATLAPAAILSLLTLVVLPFLSADWVAWGLFIFGTNLAGGMGDFYTSRLLLYEYSKDVIVKDDGTAFTVYTR